MHIDRKRRCNKISTILREYHFREISAMLRREFLTILKARLSLGDFCAPMINQFYEN
jgi:hypothetical protein